jgi:small conductance mechanosensitive channel
MADNPVKEAVSGGLTLNPDTFLTIAGASIAAIIVIYILFHYLPRLMETLFEKAPGLRRVDKTLSYFIADSLGIGMVFVLIIYGITLLPQNATLIAMLVTIASGAFIFLSEGWFGDALAGIGLQLFRQFKVGDWVTLGGDKRGKVARVGLFRTRIQTLALDVVSIKNAKILSEDIINHSGMPLRRMDLTVHTADYGDFGHNIHEYKAAIKEVADQVQDYICPEARESGLEPGVFLTEFGSSSDHIHLIFFTYDRDEVYGSSMDAMHTALADRLRPNGVVLGQVNANTIDNVVEVRHVTPDKS